MIMRVVIPAPYQVRGKLQRESSWEDWIPDQVRDDVLSKVISEAQHWALFGRRQGFFGLF